MGNRSRYIEYPSWRHMKKRCLDPRDSEYHNYGGRGITVCKEWVNSIDAFIQDVGRRPGKGWSIDRIDNNKGYYKENCRWANQKTQMRNRRNNVFDVVNGERLILQEIADMTGISRSTLHYRFRRGLRGEELMKPVDPMYRYKKAA